MGRVFLFSALRMFFRKLEKIKNLDTGKQIGIQLFVYENYQ